MGTILLVCTGNICRSPMATGILSKLLSDRGLHGVRVESCGVSAWDGSPPTPEAVEVVREQGIDISGNAARRMNRRLIEAADLVVGMSSEHRDAARRLVPAAKDRIFTLKELVHLLAAADPSPQEGTQEEQLRRWTERANGVRKAYPDLELTDENIADPLGRGLEAYQASAWELAMLCERLVEVVFEAAGPARVGIENDAEGPAWAEGLGEREGRRG